MADSVREELEEVVRLLVDYPDEVEAFEIDEGRTVTFELAVDPDDLGKVIGRQGRTARSLRALLDARAQLEGASYELQILEEDEL